jgi:hypothetical protein
MHVVLPWRYPSAVDNSVDFYARKMTLITSRDGDARMLWTKSSVVAAVLVCITPVGGKADVPFYWNGNKLFDERGKSPRILL